MSTEVTEGKSAGVGKTQGLRDQQKNFGLGSEV